VTFYDASSLCPRCGQETDDYGGHVCDLDDVLQPRTPKPIGGMTAAQQRRLGQRTLASDALANCDTYRRRILVEIAAGIRPPRNSTSKKLADVHLVVLEPVAMPFDAWCDRPDRTVKLSDLGQEVVSLITTRKPCSTPTTEASAGGE